MPLLAPAGTLFLNCMWSGCFAQLHMSVHTGDSAELLADGVAAAGALAATAPHISYFTTAAAWLSSIMMIAFALAGCYCLSNMQFKQDSLLYPRQKAE